MPVSSGVMRRTVYAAVASFGSVGRDLQILLAIALARHVLRRHLELLGEHGCDRLGAAVGQRQIVDVGADRVGMALDQDPELN
jgi:hypothetical protein